MQKMKLYRNREWNCSSSQPQGIHTLLDIFRTSTEFAESDAVLPWGRYLTRFHFSACCKFTSKKYKAASELHWPVLTWPQHLWSDLFCKNESASAETQDPRKLHICYHSHYITAVGQSYTAVRCNLIFAPNHLHHWHTCLRIIALRELHSYTL